MAIALDRQEPIVIPVAPQTIHPEMAVSHCKTEIAGISKTPQIGRLTFGPVVAASGGPPKRATKSSRTSPAARPRAAQTLGIEENENCYYSIYPDFTGSIGFTQRGCRLKCPFRG